ncbi:MAG: tetratricopeptide repeat protein [Thermoanaerobaculia bacterium]
MTARERAARARRTALAACVSALLAAPALPAMTRPAKSAPARSFETLVREAREDAAAGNSRARDRYLAAIEQKPSDTALRAELADYFWKIGDPTEAESQMDWLVAHGHPRPGFLRYYGLRLFDAGNFVKASKILESASREGPPDDDLLFCLGSARLEEGDFRGAEEALRGAIRKAPSKFAARHVLGNLLKLTGRPAEAVVELRRAAESGGDSADIWLDLAQALAADGHPGEAEEACRKSLRIQPDRAAAHMTLGRILRSEGKADEAAAELTRSRLLYDREEENVEKRRSSQARVSEVWVLKRRAESLEERGRREDAIQALERAKSLAPEDRSLDYALEKLRASGPKKR